MGRTTSSAEPREGASPPLAAFAAHPGVGSFPVSGWFLGGFCSCKPAPSPPCLLAALSHQPLPGVLGLGSNSGPTPAWPWRSLEGDTGTGA